MKKIALMCLALVLTLGTLGVAYAYWDETLTISGTVATGDLDIHLTDKSCADNEDPALDVGILLCEWTLPDSEGGYDGAKITVTNAYPSYTATCYFTIHNCGTIPAKVDVRVVSKSDQLDVSISNDPNFLVMLKPCETYVFDVVIHVNDLAAENGSYSASIAVDAKQFNQ